MNLEHFQPHLRYQSKSVFGEFDIQILHTDEHFQHIGVLREFLSDDDLHEITCISTCIGFVKTYTKQFKKEGK